MRIGIESINFYGARAVLDIRMLFEVRELDMRRFDNLMLVRKSVALPCEDPVTLAVNAAKPLIEAMSAEDRARIELVIVGTESGIDFGKSMTTYVHHYLGLGRTCRLFEIKQACYGATAALQMAVGFVASQASLGAKALVIGTDIGRATIRGSYVEPSQGAGAVAMIVGDEPDVFELDFGANGYHGYEVMDTCRPAADIETGDSDLSLIAYLDCLEHSFAEYARRVEGADFFETFDYLAFHTPFPGMVKGAHRMLLRKLRGTSPAEAEADFDRRVTPSLRFCAEIGNIYSATVYLALCGLIDGADLFQPRRIGVYSYGSGCCGEFYSGVAGPGARTSFKGAALSAALADRYVLSMPEYEQLLDAGLDWVFGVKDQEVDLAPYRNLYDQTLAGRGLLVLKGVRNYHREYDWS
ncbi:MAG: hydroxymethylglutaryl-CoA synthase family protein [Candidatus Synoicihabitans palmerolidicus]|nr:hydroxymethylglutaryl-CoA synthase family protein [Candidatus Synoicihabitans palmerolidicus]MCC5025190.1 hydroxymethylglutaryl-CoA synthase family protein [Candidatus Synoicihabitans palmerolidicus]MCC5025739.1 hydroxymethylglutaryl-CoA synthase family protein [Candidatus Synoicihabitans palmerolidicus]MCC5025868.1 hydroxymethylglutaryl-CoA synthase family protein [Candidatus Synoicihabitans palmerolidicus]MCC5025881.1 hydroxymethylglutaryl-CoA synthase family protein [Candidatus Synoicihab